MLPNSKQISLIQSWLKNYYYNHIIGNEKRKKTSINDKNLILFYYGTTGCFAMSVQIQQTIILKTLVRKTKTI